MKLSVSNIAWPPDLREQAHTMLAAHGVTGLEIAPGLTFPGGTAPLEPSDAAVAAFHADLRRHGLQLTSMQSLLFGVGEAQLFGDAAALRAFEAGVRRAIRLAERLGVPNLVMGSPTARAYAADWTDAEVEARADAVFARLGDACVAAGCVLALEPNPAAYGTNFLNTFAETLAYARRLDHPGVRVNLDLGAVAMNAEGEAMLAALPGAVDQISHVHVSEPNLASAPADPEGLAVVLRALDAAGYEGAVSIEMRGGAEPLDQLETSLDACRAAFDLAGIGAPM